MTDLNQACAALVRDADRDRWLATLYAPAATRPALLAVHALDLEFAKVAATTSDAMLGEIRLAWWRERLVDLDRGVVPAQPVLQALAAEVVPRGVTGAALAGFEDGWLALAADDVPGFIAGRGAALGAIVAQLLGGDPLAGSALGRVWAAGEAARLGSATHAETSERADKALRPLAGLAALGARDAKRAVAGMALESRATPVRQLVLLRTVLTGR